MTFKARIVLSASDLIGQPVTTVKVGQPFLLNMSVQDLRPNGTFVPLEGLYAHKQTPYIRGVYAAYCDVAFPITKVQVQPAVNFLDAFKFLNPYTNGKSAVKTTGGIRWWGAFSNVFEGLGTNLIPMSSVSMLGIAPGIVTFTPMLNSLGPAWDFLVYGNLLSNPPEQSIVAHTDIRLYSVTVNVQ